MFMNTSWTLTWTIFYSKYATIAHCSVSLKMGQACRKNEYFSEEEFQEDNNSKNQFDTSQKQQNKGHVQFKDDLEEKLVENKRRKKVKNRKPTGKKLKKKALYNLEKINSKYEEMNEGSCGVNELSDKPATVRRPSTKSVFSL